MKSIKYFNVTDKRVLVRCDFNVPLDERGNVLDDFRIKKTLPTIQYLMKEKAKIILMSHLGNPNGEIVSTLTLDKVKERLEALLKITVIKVDDCIGSEVEDKVSWLMSKQILLLENLRFHKEETNNDPAFAEKLSKLADIYINDAFGECHRNYASIVSVPQYLPHGMGMLLEKELENLSIILTKPKKPIVAIIGGAKVETKAKFIEKISEIADVVLINGLIKKEFLASSLRGDSRSNLKKIIGPEKNLEAKDIDQNTINIFKEKIRQAKTIVWNGPFGRFEDEHFKKGTLEIAKAIIQSKAFSVVGGGETIEFLHKEGMLDKFSHVSTGGGAMLDFLSGDKLPGIEVLK